MPGQASATIEAWTLTRPVPAPLPGLLAFEVQHSDGRSGVLRALERVHAGPDGGQGTLEVLARLERTTDPRIARPMGQGFGTWEGKAILYVVTPPLPGAPLAEFAAVPGALQPGEMVGALVQAAEGLGAAHGVGTPHGNIHLGSLYLVQGGRLVVGEFGLAPWPAGSPAPQRQLPAPELRRGGPATFAGDVFSLALVGAGILCGKDALRRWRELAPGTEAGDVMPALERVGAPPDVIRAIMSALHPDPVARPSALTLANQLRPRAAPLPDVARSADPRARVDAWLGEKSDPKRVAPPPAAAAPAPAPVPAPAPAPVPAPASAPAAAAPPTVTVAPVLPSNGLSPIPPSQAPTLPLPVSGLTSLSVRTATPAAGTSANPFLSSSGGFEEVAVTESSIIADSADAVDPPPPAPAAASANTTLPPPAGAILEERPAPPPPQAPPPPPPPSLPPTAARTAPPPATPAATAPAPGPLSINLATLPIVIPRSGDFPLVARWTERTAGKGQSPVEIVRPRTPAGATPPQSQVNRLTVLALLFGLLAGGFAARGAGRAEPGPGSLRLESSLQDAEVEVTAELDGRAVGRLPLDLSGVGAGPHVVVLRGEGADPAVVHVVVETGKRALVRGAPEFFSARLSVTSSARSVTVARGEDPPRALPAEFDDLDPDSDVKLVFRVGDRVLHRTVHVGNGETTFHLEVEAPAARPEDPGASPAPSPAPLRPPPPPPPPPPAASPRDPEAAASAVAEGNRALLAGEFDAAQAAMERALKADPGQADAHKGLGVIHARLNHSCDALRSYRKYLEVRPAASDADRVRAIIRELEQKAPDCT